MTDISCHDLLNVIRTAIYHQVQLQYHDDLDEETRRRVIESMVDNIARLALDPIWLFIKEKDRQLAATQQKLDTAERYFRLILNHVEADKNVKDISDRYVADIKKLKGISEVALTNIKDK